MGLLAVTFVAALAVQARAQDLRGGGFDFLADEDGGELPRELSLQETQEERLKRIEDQLKRQQDRIDEQQKKIDQLEKQKAGRKGFQLYATFTEGFTSWTTRGISTCTWAAGSSSTCGTSSIYRTRSRRPRGTHAAGHHLRELVLPH
jgi:hypothetical protein